RSARSEGRASFLLRLLLLLARAFERASRLREEHVVEARCVQLEVLDLDSFRVERSDYPGQVLRAVGQPDRDALGRAVRSLSEAVEDARERRGVGAVPRNG